MHKQVVLLLTELEQQVSKDPKLKSHFEQLLQCTQHVNKVHGLQQALLAKLRETHSSVQSAQLQQTQGQVAGFYKLLQEQSQQLQHTQRQVQGLQAFGVQAKLAVQEVAKSHDTRLRATQSQVTELQLQLASALNGKEKKKGQLVEGQSTEGPQLAEGTNEQEVALPVLLPKAQPAAPKLLQAVEDELSELAEFPSSDDDEWC